MISILLKIKKYDKYIIENKEIKEINPEKIEECLNFPL